MGNTQEKTKEELRKAKDVPGLWEVLKKYPEFRKELEPHNHPSGNLNPGESDIR